MNLWFRLLLLLAATPFRTRLAAPLGVSRLAFRVWPNDLDINWHMNNGRYLTIMDLGRFDLILRMGMAGPARRNGWIPVLSAANVVFRRELRPLQKFFLESRIVWWSETHFLMEHRMLLPGDNGHPGVLAARAIMHGGIYQRRRRRFVPVTELLQELGLAAQSPPLTPELSAALAAGKAMRESDRSASAA